MRETRGGSHLGSVPGSVGWYPPSFIHELQLAAMPVDGRGCETDMRKLYPGRFLEGWKIRHDSRDTASRSTASEGKESSPRGGSQGAIPDADQSKRPAIARDLIPDCCRCKDCVVRYAVDIFSEGDWLRGRVIKVYPDSVLVEWSGRSGGVHYKKLKRPEQTSDAKKIDQRIQQIITLYELGLPSNCQDVEVWSPSHKLWIEGQVVEESSQSHCGKITVQYNVDGSDHIIHLPPGSQALRKVQKQRKREAEEIEKFARRSYIDLERRIKTEDGLLAIVDLIALGYYQYKAKGELQRAEDEGKLMMKHLASIEQKLKIILANINEFWLINPHLSRELHEQFKTLNFQATSLSTLRQEKQTKLREEMQSSLPRGWIP